MGPYDQYIFFDVETPNSNNDRICAIAVSFGDNSETFYSLVNPEVDFSPYNNKLHGINKRCVESSPIFPNVWKKIEGHFVNKIVVVHNASYDLNVLGKTLLAYKIDIPVMRYIDTLDSARNAFPEMKQHHSLNDLCSSFDIPLEHHDVKSDAEAVCQLFKKIPDEFLVVKSFPKEDNKQNSNQNNEEYEEKKQLFREFKNNHNDFCKGETFIFDNAHFVLTGEFRVPRKDVIKMIKERGGIVDERSTKETNYIVMGEYESNWKKQDGFGGKLENARKYRGKGCDIKFMHEETLLNSLGK